MRIHHFAFSLLLFFIITCTVQLNGQTSRNNSTDRPPNFIIVLADDLGYGDLGCYGAKDIKTPNIDRMAAEGIKFTQFYSASPVCSPSRAALLTGRYPIRYGIHGVFFPDSYTGIDSQEITLPEVLKKKGYKNGMVGKWHLGHMESFRPLQHGFHSYFGIPYSNDMSSVVYLRNNELAETNLDQRYITKRYTDEAIRFMEENKQRPFFLYLAHNMPHVPIYASEKFVGTSGRGLYGDVVQELDWSVGEILKKLKEFQLEENTLIVFTSDNGPWLVMESDAGSAGILREGKQTTFEGGMRVPAVFYWKGNIKPGMVYEGVASMMDLFPTFVQLAGGRLPGDRIVDGENIASVLLKEGKRKGNELAYYYNGKLEAYCVGDWKIKLPYKGNKGTFALKELVAHDTLLFRLKDDPGEKNNLAASHPDKIKELTAKMQAFQKSLGKLPGGKFVRSEADRTLSTKRKGKE